MCTQIRTEIFSVGPDLGSNCLKKVISRHTLSEVSEVWQPYKKIKLGKNGNTQILNSCVPKLLNESCSRTRGDDGETRTHGP